MTENASASHGSFCVSATRYRRAENVHVIAVVITKLKFRDVQRQIFTADFVEAAHDAAFQERPETVDGLSMNDAINILASDAFSGCDIRRVRQWR